MNHAPFHENPEPDWASTTLKRLSVPSPPGALIHRKTGSTESVIEIS